METNHWMKKIFFFGIVINLVFFSCLEIARSQEGMVFLENKKTVSPIKVAIIDAGFDGVEKSNFSGKIEISDANIFFNQGENKKDDIAENANVLKKNNNHGATVLSEFLEEYFFLQGEYDPNLLLIKVSQKEDGLGKVSAKEIAEAIRYAVQERVQVINLSLGTLQRSENVLAAIRYAHNQGVMVVAASGNWGEKKEIKKEQMSVYAQSRDAIAVGALEEDGAIASYTSGFGNAKLEFAAIPSLGKGTSLAAPIVSAAITNVLEGEISVQEDDNKNDRWDQEEVKKALSSRAENRIFSL